MDARQERGLQIAEQGKIMKIPMGWKVPSQSGVGNYVVMLGDHPYCTCPDFENGNKCKHLHAVEFTIQRQRTLDGVETVTRSIKVTCTQEWPVYDRAQMHEEERFVELLRDLCNGVQQSEYKFGRPRLPLSDVIFGATYKVYSTMSGRRFMTALKEAQAKELIDKAPSFASNARYLENAELTPLLKDLIARSASPLKSVESDFAIDSSCFATSTTARWMDYKWGKERTKQTWIKAHVMCGVKTHIVTSVECATQESADITQFIPLLNKTAETFAIKEVSADKAYSSRATLHAVENVGATPYIPFKGNARAMGSSPTRYDGLWHKMWCFYEFNKEAFLAHYHKRSNAESTFSMIKAKFGASVRSRKHVAQVNEVLCKVLCHNICCLIQSVFELGIEPTFWTSDTKLALVPKVAANGDF